MAIHWPDPAVFLAWDLRVERIEAVRDAYRVVTARGQFCLKRASGPPERVEVIARALDHLTRRGFHQLTPFLLTRQGRPFCQHGEACYYLTEWLPGKRPDLSRPEMAASAARCLASFHAAAEGFFDYGCLRQHLRQWPERLSERVRELRALQADRTLEFKPDRFTEAFLASAERWTGLAEWALDLLAQSGYFEEVEAFRARGGFCHGDPAERNFVWWRGEPFLIDFDTLLVDLPVLDLARLVRRVDQNVQWRLELAEQMIGAYEAVRPLNAHQRGLLLALLAFPEKYWRVAHRYYRAREGKSRRHLLHRLAEVEASWGPVQRFLPMLADRLGVGLPRPLPAGQ
ncbi:MAG: CotS family spore coat protein [Bacillota bacterium]|nr:CotS family spore coat protein [Bacillota bacterium]